MLVESIIAVIDRIIELLRIRSNRRRRLLESLLRPLFEDIEKIFKDYEEILSATDNILPFGWERNQNDYLIRLRQAASSLQKTRVELLPARIRLRALSSELAGRSFPPNISEFIESVIQFFPTGNFSRSLDLSLLGSQEWSESPSTLVIEQIERQMLEPCDPDPKELIHQLLHSHRLQWRRVCAAYSRLLIDMASSD